MNPNDVYVVCKDYGPEGESVVAAFHDAELLKVYCSGTNDILKVRILFVDKPYLDPIEVRVKGSDIEKIDSQQEKEIK